MTRLLHDNITEGTGTAAYTGCVGQAGKTGTTDNETDAWFSGYQPNLATAVWVGYPESNAISMTDVHGITVFGGTFPAEIWHSLYADAGVQCDEFDEPEEEIEWAPGYGAVHRRGAGDRGGETAKGHGDRRAAKAKKNCPARARSAATTRTPTPPASARNRPRCRRPCRPQDGGPEPGVGGGKQPAKCHDVDGPKTRYSPAASRRPPARRVAAHRRGACLRPDLGGVPRLPRRALGGAAARRPRRSAR